MIVGSLPEPVDDELELFLSSSDLPESDFVLPEKKLPMLSNTEEKNPPIFLTAERINPPIFENIPEEPESELPPPEREVFVAPPSLDFLPPKILLNSEVK
jgi:hypothetical protein